jgi:mRNA-degrading endonuclease RelE of RelBE toxin-antitoxin system
MSERQDHYHGLFLAASSLLFWACTEFVPSTLSCLVRKTLVFPSSLDPKNEGKPVYLSGTLLKDDLITDTLFDVKKDCLRLRRNVQKLTEQWNTVHDEKELVFQCELKAEGPYDLAPLKVNPEIIDEIRNEFVIQPKNVPKKIEEELKGKGYSVLKNNKYYYVAKTEEDLEKYRAKKGDFRVFYTYVPNRAFVSVLGEQRNGFVVPIRGKYLIVKDGFQSPDDLIGLLPSEINHWSYVGRIIGPLGIFAGIYIHLKQQHN